MKSRITLIKSYRNKETLRLMEVQELADMNKECHLVLQLRQKNRVTFETKMSWEISS